MSLAIASTVPDEPTPISKPSCLTAGSIVASIERTNLRQPLTALGCRASDPKNLSVNRTAPSLKLRESKILSPVATTISVEPPPISQSNICWSPTPIACLAPRWISRASSIPEMTSISTPASFRARLMKSSRFSASRTALVATARSLAL